MSDTNILDLKLKDKCFDVCGTVNIEFHNYEEDYLKRHTVVKMDGGAPNSGHLYEFLLRIDPFPHCCGFRIINDSNFYLWNSKDKETLFPLWIKAVQFGIALDNKFCMPGRYLFACVVNAKDDKENIIDHTKVYSDYLAQFAIASHKAIKNPIMNSYNMLFEIATPKSNNYSKCDLFTVPAMYSKFEPY